LSGLKRRDPTGVLVDADHVVAEIGKAGPGNEPDIAGTDHCNAHELLDMVNGPTAGPRLLAEAGLHDETWQQDFH
jgi:hypothetical protein